MSDYELLDKFISCIDQLSNYNENELDELIDIAKDYLNDKEFNLLKVWIYG